MRAKDWDETAIKAADKAVEDANAKRKREGKGGLSIDEMVDLWSETYVRVKNTRALNP